jgi:gluconokinase
MNAVGAAQAETPLVLALDLGSSSLRAIAYDRLGREVEGAVARTEYEWRRTPDGGVEADPDTLLAGTFAAIDRALAALGSHAERLRAVGISTFWHNIMGLGPDGRSVTPLYSWADERSADAAATLRRRLDADAARRRTGCVFHPSYPAARLLWLREERPLAYRAASAWLSIGEYLALRCFGRAACSVSMASGTGLLDLRRCEWDAPLLEAVGLSPDRLSPLVDLDAAFTGLRSDFAQRWPALARIPWLPAAAGAEVRERAVAGRGPERAALSLGTSGAIRVLQRGPVPDVPAGLWIYRLDRARTLFGGALSNGGSVHRWLVDQFAAGPSEDVERALRARPPDGHGLTVLPFLAGERSPDWPLLARGAIVGMTLRTDSLDLVQAGLEAVAYRFALIWELVRAAVPGVREIVASGGAPAGSPAWVQILADVLGHEIVVSEEAEGSSRGAALAALEMLGAAPAADALPGRAAAYVPDAARHARYRAARARQRRIEGALAPLQPQVAGYTR